MSPLISNKAISTLFSEDYIGSKVLKSLAYRCCSCLSLQIIVVKSPFYMLQLLATGQVSTEFLVNGTNEYKK